MGVAAGIDASAAGGADTAEHGCCFTVDQTAGGEAGNALLLAVVGHLTAIGGDGSLGLTDIQATCGVADGVVVGAQAADAEVIVAGVDRALCATTVDQRAAKHADILAIDEAAVADAVAASEGEAIVSLAGVVGGYGERGLVDGQGGIGVADVVALLARIQPVQAEPSIGGAVAAGILRGAGVGQATKQQIIIQGSAKIRCIATGAAALAIVGFIADVRRRDGHALHETAQQRCSLPFIDPPHCIAAAAGGQVPGGIVGGVA